MMIKEIKKHIQLLSGYVSEDYLVSSWDEAMEMVDRRIACSLRYSPFLGEISFEIFLQFVVFEQILLLENLREREEIKVFKISKLEVSHLNTKVLAENVKEIVGSEDISDFLLVLNEEPQKIKRISGIGRKTLPNLLRAIEQAGYDVPKIIIF